MMVAGCIEACFFLMSRALVEEGYVKEGYVEVKVKVKVKVEVEV